MKQMKLICIFLLMTGSISAFAQAPAVSCDIMANKVTASGANDFDSKSNYATLVLDKNKKGSKVW